MKIKSQEIKQLNITAVFSEIDHTSITAEKMRKVFELTEEEKKNSPFLEPLPVVKILAIPNRKKDIIIEDKRLRINDHSGLLPKDSDLIKYFRIAFEDLTDKKNLIAYGFNYDILVKSKVKIDFKKFLERQLIKNIGEQSVLETAIRIMFKKQTKRFDLQISPTGNPYQLLFHLNSHYALKKIIFNELNKQFNQDYLFLTKIIQKI